MNTARSQIYIGSYGYDRSMVCINRDTEVVSCFQGVEFAKLRKTWPNLENWLIEEIRRLSILFDSDGKLLVSEDQLLPDAGAPQPN